MALVLHIPSLEGHSSYTSRILNSMNIKLNLITIIIYLL